MDGIEILSRLKAILGDVMPPGILVAAFDEVLMRRQALEVNVDAVLLKPITPSALHDAHARTLHRTVVAPAPAPASGQDAIAQMRRLHAGHLVVRRQVEPVEAVDPESGRQPAALRLSHFAPLSAFRACCSKLAPAELAVRKAAADFAALPQPLPARSPIATASALR